MDHASARLLEYASNKTQIKLIEPKGEKATHHKKQQEDLIYYKNIVAAIKNYSKVLFGPSEEKKALYNFPASDPYFKKIKITMKTTDK